MTTRDQARRRGLDRTEASRPPVAVEAVPSLPERLLAAREHKGVDLYRAERDTKIRARYLGALERGDYRELPGAVYTKGFLRNYALYLGLDPEDILAQWHRERGDAGPQEPVIVPRVLEAPRRGLTFTPGILVAVLLTVVLALFGGYMALQLS
ncbi:MAG TPA: helix-turn-helix transcriptional regulator, partial [Candidatus Limnocylindrales bacterium]